jgi:hypothetical protein
MYRQAASAMASVYYPGRFALMTTRKDPRRPPDSSHWVLQVMAAVRLNEIQARSFYLTRLGEYRWAHRPGPSTRWQTSTTT